MSDNTFPHAQQIWTFWERATQVNVAALETKIDTSVAATKASFDYASKVSEQWGKLVTDAAQRFSKTA